jgi:hypothetical protein
VYLDMNGSSSETTCSHIKRTAIFNKKETLIVFLRFTLISERHLDLIAENLSERLVGMDRAKNVYSRQYPQESASSVYGCASISKRIPTFRNNLQS